MVTMVPPKPVSLLYVADVVVELPQTPEDDMRSARAARGRRTS